MIPRKVVAGYSVVFPDLGAIHYRITDQGDVWSKHCDLKEWIQEAPLPPREDEVGGLLASNELRLSEELGIAQMTQSHNSAQDFERLRADLRRVRDALDAFLKGTQAPQIVEPMAALWMINKEPMP